MLQRIKAVHGGVSPTTDPLMRVSSRDHGHLTGSFLHCVYKYGSFIFKTQRSTTPLCILRNDNSDIYFCYGHGLLAATLSLFLFIKAHSVEKKKIFISVFNKETVADIYPAELNADHMFNFAEQTPPCFTVCVCVGLFAATLNLYLQCVHV